MTADIQVSIIMNCYNGEKYLRAAIDSVLEQSYENWEIIFWDNRSSDRSAEIVKSIDDKRIRYFLADQHTDLGHARNDAVDRARGEWLAFLDSDDIWLPQKLTKQTDIIRQETNDLALVYGQMELLLDSGAMSSKWGTRMNNNADKLSSKSLPEGFIFQDLLKENFIPMVSSMVRKDKYLEVGGINPGFNRAEDYDLFVKLAENHKVRAVQDVICRYRIHETNMSHEDVGDNYTESIQIVSRYLPDPAAVESIKIYETLLAVEEIRNGELRKGACRLLGKGNMKYIVGRSLPKLKKIFT